MECTTSGENPKVDYALWVIMCQYKFINWKKCIALVGEADNAGGSACVGGRGMWGISVPSSQFYCEPKVALKN